MTLSSIIALPSISPVPTAMILHALGIDEQSFMDTYSSQEQNLLDQLAKLEKQVHMARDYVFPLACRQLYSLGKDKLPLKKWLQLQLAEQLNSKPQLRIPVAETNRTYSASYRTLNTWEDNAVLLRGKSDRMVIDRMVAILTMSIVDGRRQGFLPASIDPDAPHTWCYAKTGPQAESLPCPLPLPLDLPRGTVLYSAFPFFEDGWLWLRPPGIAPDAPLGSFKPIGAMRFSSLNFRSLARWDPTLVNPEAQLIFSDRNRELSQQAERILVRLAPHLFSPEVFPPPLPVVFDRTTLYQALTQQHI